MTNPSHILGLDFDGVLHPGGDSIHIGSGQPMPFWQFEVAMRTQGRFVWCEQLADALGDSDVAIVIHSTWRRRLADAELKQLLPSALRKRVIGLDGQMATRQDGTADEYLAEALELLRPQSLLVLDDRPEFFAQGKVRSWIDMHQGDFVVVDPGKGVGDPKVRMKVAEWAATAVDTERRSSFAACSPS